MFQEPLNSCTTTKTLARRAALGDVEAIMKKKLAGVKQQASTDADSELKNTRITQNTRMAKEVRECRREYEPVVRNASLAPFLYSLSSIASLPLLA